MLSAALIAILACVALCVVVGLWRKRNMWAWIVAYWILLAANHLLNLWLKTR